MANNKIVLSKFLKGARQMNNKFSKEGLTLDDVLPVPGHSEMVPGDIHYQVV